MTPEAVAQRLVAARPGYELVSYGEVGLPFYRITIKAHVLEHKPIGPFAEFALRSVDAGLAEPEPIRELLGLEESVVNSTLAELIESDDLALRKSANGSVTVTLTPNGKTSMDSAMTIVPQEAEIEIDYDGLLRKPVPFVVDWFSPIDLRNRGIREIPPSPTRPPETKDIDIAAVSNLIRVLGDRREAKRDLLDFRSLERRRRFQIAVALVYRGEDPTDVQVAFVIDGVPSADHEEAFARSRFKRRFIGGDAMASAEAVVEAVLGKELLESARRVQRQSPAPHAPEVGSENAAADIEAIKPPELRDGEVRELDPIRMLETFEHPAFLREALESAKDRLLIVSPWVRRAIVNEKFIGLLEERLAGGVEVLIGWGITPLSDRDIDIDGGALGDFNRLANQFKWTFACRRLGDTHAKVLVCDQRFLIVTSFNWLSFKGDPRRTFRDERGTFVALPDEIDEQFDSWSARIRQTTSPRP